MNSVFRKNPGRLESSDLIRHGKNENSYAAAGEFFCDEPMNKMGIQPLGNICTEGTHIYYGGGYFIPSGEITEFARYAVTNQIASLGCVYGAGRVLLMGFHAEVTSDGSYQQSDQYQKWLRHVLGWVLSCNNRNTPLIVYNQSGEVWDVSVAGMRALFSEMRIPYILMTAAQINTQNVQDYRGIYMPGGLGVGTSVNTTGRASLLSLINGGGAYIGICSGSYAAATSGTWEGSPFTGLGVFPGQTIGAIAAIAPWANEIETDIIFSLPVISMKKIGTGRMTIDPYRAANMDGIFYRVVSEDSNHCSVDVRAQ